MEFYSSHDTADPRYQFVLAEIELGITFVQRAETAYELGYEEHGDSAMRNAIKALASARCSIEDLDAEDQEIARKELPRLEQAVAALISEQTPQIACNGATVSVSVAWGMGNREAAVGAQCLATRHEFAKAAALAAEDIGQNLRGCEVGALRAGPTECSHGKPVRQVCSERSADSCPASRQ